MTVDAGTRFEGPVPDVSSAGAVDVTEAEVRRVALGGWRVSDARLDRDDPRHLLGFIEARGDQFEVMRISKDFIWTMFGSMQDAVAYLLTVGRQDAAARAFGELGWIASLPRNSFDDD